MRDEAAAPGFCERCGRELATGDPAPMCAQCAVEVTDAEIPRPRDEVRTPDRARGARALETIRRRGAPVLAVVLALVLLTRIPAMVDAFAAPPPSHAGTGVTDATGDRCVANLWTIADSMAEREPVDGSLVCPASGRAYVNIGERGSRVVSCPNPATHGANSLTVRSDALVPEVR
jgi:hypothetical protein